MSLRRPWSEIAAALATGGEQPATGTADGAPAQSAAGPDPSLPETPWFVRVLIGLGAWISAAFLIGFVALFVGSTAGERGGFLGLGAVLVVAGVLAVQARAGDFVSQMGLASSLAGQGLMIWGVGTLIDHDRTIAVAALVIEGVLAVFVRAAVHRFFATVGAVTALGCALVLLRIPFALDLLTLGCAAVGGWIWVRQPERWARAGRDDLVAVGYALVIATFALLLFPVVGGVRDLRDIVRDTGAPGGLTGVSLGLLIVPLVLQILGELGQRRPMPAQMLGMLLVAALGLATPGSPGVAGAVGVLLLGFHRRNPVLLGLASVFLVAFLIFLYYSLHATLLVKSLYLMGTGAALGLVPVFLRRSAR